MGHLAGRHTVRFCAEADKYAKSAVVWWRHRVVEHEVEPYLFTVYIFYLIGALFKASGHRLMIAYLSAGKKEHIKLAICGRLSCHGRWSCRRRGGDRRASSGQAPDSLDAPALPRLQKCKLCPVKVVKAVHSAVICFAPVGADQTRDPALFHTELPVFKQKASHVHFPVACSWRRCVKVCRWMVGSSLNCWLPRSGRSRKLWRKYPGQQNSIGELMADQVKAQCQGRAVRVLCQGGHGGCTHLEKGK